MRDSISFRGVDNAVIERLMREQKLKYLQVENELGIHDIFFSKRRDDSDPRARDVVTFLVSNALERGLDRVTVADSSEDDSVWLPFLNRDIYTDFKPMLDKDDLVKYLRGIDLHKYESYIKKLLEGERMGSEYIDYDLRDKLDMYVMSLLGVGRKRTYFLR